MKRLCTATLAMLLTAPTFAQRYDAPKEMMKAPGNNVWGVDVRKHGTAYRTRALTRLNGKLPLTEQPTVPIATGTTGVWKWEVVAVPSLVPSWEAWKKDPKVKVRTQEPDDWSHPAATWEQAFGRAYKVVSFMLGHEPAPLKLTVLLLPQDTIYEQNILLEDEHAIPLRLAFYYPTASETDMARRFSAMTEAVDTSVYEYQHSFVDLKTIEPVGRREVDKSINDEARSQCWSDSIFLALSANTHSETTWHQGPTGAMPPERHLEELRFSDALVWGWYKEVLTVSDYVQQRGVANNKVVSNDPAAMNAVLSVCRALTQKPFDLTSGPYPKERIEFVPFFPDPLPPPVPAPETAPK